MLLAAPISYAQAIALGLVQGVSELFPISSLGHIVILPSLLGWNIHQNGAYFLSFSSWQSTWRRRSCCSSSSGRTGFASSKACGGRSVNENSPRTTPHGRLGWLLIVGTIPAGILGLLFEASLRSAFASARFASVVLIANGIMLYGAERLRRRAPDPDEGVDHYPGEGDQRVARRTSWAATVGIGATQALALLPGFSRSGATMSGGLLVGLSNEDAARFSFLLATPIIAAAALRNSPTSSAQPETTSADKPSSRPSSQQPPPMSRSAS